MAKLRIRLKSKPDVKIDYVLGVSRKGAYDSRNNAAVRGLGTKLKTLLSQYEKNIIASDLHGLQEVIVENLRRDLAIFMGQMINYFMRQKFSVNGYVRDISFPTLPDDVTGRGETPRPAGYSIILKDPEAVMGSAFKGGHLLWPGLAAATIRKKLSKPLAMSSFERETARLVRAKGLESRPLNGSVYYFHWSGALADVIHNEITSRLLGDDGIISPSVSFTTTDAKGPFQRGDRLGAIKVRIFERQTLGAGFHSALSSGDWTRVDDTSLLSRFLSQSVAEKLNGSPRAALDVKRPWVGPSIAYWIINRVPYIVVKSIKKTVDDNKSARSQIDPNKASIDRL